MDCVLWSVVRDDEVPGIQSGGSFHDLMDRDAFHEMMHAIAQWVKKKNDSATGALPVLCQNRIGVPGFTETMSA